MGIRMRLWAMMAVPCVALGVLVAVGGSGAVRLASEGANATNRRDSQFAEFWEKNVRHLVETMPKSLRQTLEAERQAWAAVAAEKAALVAGGDETRQRADALSQQSLQQVETLMREASKSIDDPDLKKLHGEFPGLLKEWAGHTRAVIEDAGTPDKAALARQSSDTGASQRSFVKVSEALSAIAQRQQDALTRAQTALGTRRQALRQEATEDGLRLHAAGTAALNSLLWVAVPGLLLSLLACGWATSRIAGGLDRAVRLAESVRKGILSLRTGLSSGDAIGRMGTALDALADSLQQKTRLAQAIASGNLATEVALASEEDQLGLALRHMKTQLTALLQQVTRGVNQVFSGSEQMSGASQSLSQGATKQASSLEEISSSIAEVASQTKRNAENAAQARQLSAGAREAATRGGQEIEQMVAAMKDINASSQQTAKVIKVIDDIAFQINLLALNAAVEAARAGRHGRGFAVVADEVRNLASRSAKAARETGELIEGSGKKVTRGLDVAEATSKSFREISDGTVKVADLVGDIATASDEQARALAQIAQGVEQVNEVTQQNTSDAEKTAAAAEELSGQAAHLRELAGQFKLSADEAATPGDSRHAGARTEYPVQVPSPAPPAGGWSAAPKNPVPAPSGAAPANAASTPSLDDKGFGKY
jgi:methyl-accepting chemotaxis protein